MDGLTPQQKLAGSLFESLYIIPKEKVTLTLQTYNFCYFRVFMVFFICKSFYLLFMSIFFLVLFVVLIAYLSLLFLSKKYPAYFPKNVLFRKDSVIFLFLSIFILYLTIAFLVLGFSEIYKQNDINCYKGHFFLQKHFN